MKFMVSKLIYILCFVTLQEGILLYDICVPTVYSEMYDAIKIIFSRTGGKNINNMFYLQMKERFSQLLRVLFHICRVVPLYNNYLYIIEIYPRHCIEQMIHKNIFLCSLDKLFCLSISFENVKVQCIGKDGLFNIIYFLG